MADASGTEAVIQGVTAPMVAVPGPITKILDFAEVLNIPKAGATL